MIKYNLQTTLGLGVLLFFLSCQPSATTESNSANASVLTSGSAADRAIPSVSVMKPIQRSFNSALVITGSVKPDKSVMLHAMEEGFVKSISVDIGDRVNKGQTLAQLSNPMIEYEMKTAQVKVKEAEAALRSAQAQVKLTEADHRAKSSIYQKIKSVYDQSKGLTTITELENARRDSEMSAAQKEAAAANVDRYQAEIEAAKAMTSAISERKAMLTVKAPFSGNVTGRYVDPGAMIQNALTNDSAKPIVSIESNNPARLSLPLAESDISGIKEGDMVTLDFPTLPGEQLTAKISRIAKSLDPASKTMEVQIDLPNKDGKIKAGMYAKAQVQRTSSASVLSLPQAAVLMKKDAAFALIVKDGIVKEVQLKKGLSGRDYFEVLNADITAESTVIIQGKSTVTAGQKVNAVLKK